MNEYIQTSGITPIGTLIAFLGNTSPDGYLICDGTEYNITDYPEFTNFLTIQFGSVNYFGGDGINTFAVPNLIDTFIKGSDAAGVLQNAGLPNITGNIGTINAGQDWSNWISKNTNGAFSPIDVRNIVGVSNGSIDNIYMATFDASRSSSVYGNSSTVTPKNISVLYCIKVK